MFYIDQPSRHPNAMPESSTSSLDQIDWFNSTSDFVDVAAAISLSCPSAPDRWPSKDVALAFFKTLAMVAIMVSAVCGNLLVIVSVLRYERLRLIANSFLVSLAVADLLVAVVVMPFNAVQQVAGRWPFGHVACDVFNANDVLFSTASLLHLCCVSVDRYVAVTDPFGYDRRMTTRAVGAMLACLWTLSAVLAHVPIHLGWYRVDATGGSPTPNESTTIATTAAMGGCVEVEKCLFEVNKIYGVVSCAISFWFPAIIMVFAYFRIYRAAQHQAKFIQSLSLSTSSSTDRLEATGNGIAVVSGGIQRISSPDSVGGRSIHAPQPNQRQERRKMRREHKAAKTLGVIMGAFLFCWVPFFTWYVISAVCASRCPATPPVVVSVLFWIGYFNSALNPLIYALFNRDFRHAFQRTLRSCCRCGVTWTGRNGGVGWADTGNGLSNRRMVQSATEETWLR